VIDHRFPRGTHQTRRGGRYDRTHQLARAAAAKQHRPTDLCTRCGQPLGPMGRWLHYDHAEGGGYLGFAHGACNTRAGAIKGNRISRNLTTPTARWVL
jgi:hypothetical protein